MNVRVLITCRQSYLHLSDALQEHKKDSADFFFFFVLQINFIDPKIYFEQRKINFAILAFSLMENSSIFGGLFIDANMSKVSIIVPVHNTEKYLEMAVASLVAQTLKDIEIILVENGSTDSSLVLCHKLAETDERIKVLHLDKGDTSTARNLGLSVAMSEYVAFVDSDDTVLPDMYETLYSHATGNDLDLLYCNHVMIYDNRPPKYPLLEDGTLHLMSPKEMLAMNFSGQIDNIVCTMLVRRRLFDALRFPENMSFEDRAFSFLLIDASEKVGYIRKAFYNYYQRKGSVCHTMDWKRYYDFTEADSRRLRFLRDSEMFSDEEKRVLAEKLSDSIIRRLRHLHAEAKTARQKELSREMTQNMDLIPEGCRLPLKARIFRRYIKAFYM